MKGALQQAYIEALRNRRTEMPPIRNDAQAITQTVITKAMEEPANEEWLKATPPKKSKKKEERKS